MTIETYKKMQYLKILPENFNSDKEYAVMIYLHGAGSRGNFEVLAKSPPVQKFKEIAKAQELSFVFLCPLCPAGITWFDVFEQLLDFTGYVRDSYKGKLLLSGVSMGGYASWQLLMSKKDLFAAAAICCGGGMYWNAWTIKMPVLAVHGVDDDVVLARESEIMAQRINASGGHCELVLYPGVKHDSWSKFFSEQNTYEWLLEKTKINTES